MLIIVSVLFGLGSVYLFRNKPSNTLILFGILCVIMGSFLNMTNGINAFGLIIGFILFVSGFCLGLYGLISSNDKEKNKTDYS